jgi:hypothetical protein
MNPKLRASAMRRYKQLQEDDSGLFPRTSIKVFNNEFSPLFCSKDRKIKWERKY